MKRFALILAVLVVLVVGALALVIATFDADRYRPRIVEELARATGKPVRLGRLSLGWRHGLVLQCQELVIDQDAEAKLEPLLQVEAASATVRLIPLLKRRVEIASIVLKRPRLHVSRDAKGQLNLTGLAVVGAPAAAPARTAASDGKTVSLAIEVLVIDDASLHWTDAMSQPPADLWLQAVDVTVTNIAPGTPMEIDAQGALGGTHPNLRLRGRLVLPGPNSAGSVERLKLDGEGLSLEAILPNVPEGEPRLRGRASLHLEGALPTLAPTRITEALTATGTVRVAEPVVENLNVLREAFKRLSMLPGLVESLEARLPEDYRSKLTAQHTALSPIDCSAKLERGVLHFSETRFQSDAFRLTGSGRVALNGFVEIRALLQVDPTLTAAVTASVHELQALANAQGELEFPLVIQGQAPQIAVLPDLQYVASKVIAVKAQEVIGSLLQKLEERASQQRPADQPEQPPPPNLLGDMLQRVLGQQAPASGGHSPGQAPASGGHSPGQAQAGNAPQQ